MKQSLVSLHSKSEPESGSVKADGYMFLRNLNQTGWTYMCNKVTYLQKERATANFDLTDYSAP